MDDEITVAGEGPFLLVTLGGHEGPLLRRFQTYAEANVAAINYVGPDHFLFEAGRQLGFAYPDHPLGSIPLSEVVRFERQDGTPAES